ncbi:hypothetical protein C4J92_2833 [Pseudomonas sp. R3-18-08]|nr:hypothetical protein C4J92_2833 [Pseudomonas sp. R3-18-08]
MRIIAASLEERLRKQHFGQFTLSSPRGCWISIPIFDDTACEFASVSGHGGVEEMQVAARCFLRLQQNPSVEERLWLNAMPAIESPGWVHS